MRSRKDEKWNSEGIRLHEASNYAKADVIDVGHIHFLLIGLLLLLQGIMG